MKPLDSCRHIQNKAFFFPPPPEGYDEMRTLATPCWCQCTHEPVGPDGGEVSLERCTRRRACYHAFVELP